MIKTKTIKILHLEDVPSDAELIEWELHKGQLLFEKLVVDNKADFEKALKEFSPDIILSDHTLPAFDSIQALQMMKDTGKDIPFIIITATMSEEYAVEVMKVGAYDYILKDRLKRLPIAVLNAIDKNNAQKALQKNIALIASNERQFRNTLDNMLEGVQIHDFNWRYVYVNDALVKYSKYTREELIGFTMMEKYPGLEQADLFNAMQRCMNERVPEHLESEFVYPDGTTSHFEISLQPIPEGVSILSVDRTEQNRATEKLIHRNRDLEQFSYIISHDLRAPVANIIGLSAMIQDESMEADIKKVVMEGLSHSAKKLDDVIVDLNNILQTKREINQKKQLVHFSNIANDIHLSIENQLEAEKAVLKYDFSEVDEILTLKGYLNSIFYNLISNSLKYHQPGVPPVIEIKSRKHGNKIELLFKDNGLGIDLKTKGGQVFGLYKRFHTGSAEGKGIGLFMVRTQVESLGGKISIESGINTGTTFKIEFET